MSLDDMIYEVAPELEPLVSMAEPLLLQVCDVQQDTLFRLSHQKTLAFLLGKVRLMTRDYTLHTKQMQEEKKQECQLRFALSALSDVLSEEWIFQLYVECGLPLVAPQSVLYMENQPAAKAAAPKEKKSKVVPKKLTKSTTGMKPMTDYFKKKT